MAGLGSLAYTFGLRHAFDADHIAAIDNTTRKLLQDGQRPMGVGFFFSLGHSTIVFSLAAGLAIAAATVDSQIPAFQDYGGTIGASVSGTFLWVIGIINLLVLLDIVRIFLSMRRGTYDAGSSSSWLQDRGLMNRLPRPAGRADRRQLADVSAGPAVRPRFRHRVRGRAAALTAGAATEQPPFAAVLSLPILFAAGMSLMDTTDGALMCQAYGWAFPNPIRKIFYNITVTSLSVMVALVIGASSCAGAVGEARAGAASGAG